MQEDPSMSGLSYAWAAVVSVLSGWGIFSGKRLVRELDRKADKALVDLQVKALGENMHYLRARLDEIHGMLSRHGAQK